MRICFLTRTMSFGIGRYLSEIADRFSAKGHDVYILTLGSPNDETMIRPQGDARLYFMKPCKGWYLRDIPDILKEISKMDPDVLHANSIGWITAGAMVKRSLAIPLIVTFQGAEGSACPKGTCLNSSWELCYGYNFSKCKKCIGSFLQSLNVNIQIRVQRWASKYVDAVIAVSNFVKQVLKQSFPNVKNIFTIPNGVDTEKFKPIDRSKARDILGVPRDKRVILFVGRLVREKGLEVLLKAMPLVLKSFPDTICVVCGSGRDESYFKTMSCSLGIGENVIFKGYINDIVCAYSAADCAVVPSIWPDPCPHVPIEAMACACAVIASDVGGISEIIVNGKNGMLVKANNVISLAEAIIDIIGDAALQESLGTTGRRYAVKLYDWDVVYRRILAVYRSARAQYSVVQS